MCLVDSHEVVPRLPQLPSSLLPNLTRLVFSSCVLTTCGSPTPHGAPRPLAHPPPNPALAAVRSLELSFISSENATARPLPPGHLGTLPQQLHALPALSRLSLGPFCAQPPPQALQGLPRHVTGLQLVFRRGQRHSAPSGALGRGARWWQFGEAHYEALAGNTQLEELDVQWAGDCECQEAGD